MYSVICSINPGLPQLKLRQYILFLFFLLTCHIGAQAQLISRFNSFSYNVNEGLLQSTLVDMAFDRNNFCWLSFPNGVQKFDGKNFVSVPVQDGLPDDKWVRFFKTPGNDLLISHSWGISKYDIDRDRFTIVYKEKNVLKKTSQFIGEDENVLYLFRDGMIIGLDSKTFKTVSQASMGLTPDSSANWSVKFGNNVIDHKVAAVSHSMLYLWDLKNAALLHRSRPITDVPVFFVALRDGTSALYYAYGKVPGLYCYDFKTTRSSLVLPVVSGENPVNWRSFLYTWREKQLFFMNNSVYAADTIRHILNTEFVNFQNNPVAGFASIAECKEDNYGNLFLSTVNSGIKKLLQNNYPVKYYGTPERDKNFVTSILPDKKNNLILAGTAGRGLLIFDTLQRLKKHIAHLPGNKSSFSVTAILKDKQSYLLFVANETVVWRLSGDLSSLAPLAMTSSLSMEKRGFSYFGLVVNVDEKNAIVHSQNNFYKIDLEKAGILEKQVALTSPASSLLYGSSIISHTNDELIFFDAATFAVIKKIPFKNTGVVRCFAKDAANHIYMGCNKGIFKIDSTGSILSHLDKANGLPDECIYAMTIDKDGFLWCSSNKGIFRIKDDKFVLQLTRDDGLQENEFNTNAVALAEDGEIFFGGVNGISSFYPSAVRQFEDKPNLVITSLKVNNEDPFTDTAAWMLNELELPYNRNSFSFDFVAMGANNPEQYVYQYRMVGIDKEWIQNSGMQTVRYYLQPGEYTFQVYASRQFDPNAKPLKEIVIIIAPPFWKKWWFIALVAAVFLSILVYIITVNVKRRYLKKLHLLESEQQLKQERERISKDLHDSLGAYANAVLYNTELLEKEKTAEKRDALIGDLKFASKDIITSLRETVWALKKEKYTAEECLVRIRNFVQPFTRYYSHINFKITGQAPAQMDLHYTDALNLVRIVQEAVSNSIKHANAGNIKIVSEPQDNKWTMTVADDGRGYDHDLKKKLDEGNGLNNMEHRAAASGFTLSITTGTGKGTSITIIV